ncbi:MAG: hypothetical protein IT581_02550 [Verrucomicrobiales bacterium]|nr:hypothetical protein [Verrucomicrobiales bacterium]
MRIVCPTLTCLSLALLGATALADHDWDLSKVDVSKLPPASARKGVTYSKDIRPLFEASCFRCHGSERQKGDLRLDSLDAVLKGGEHGKAVVPGDSKKSLLAASCAQLNDEIAMPPKGGGGRGGRPGGPGGPGGGPKPQGAPGGQGGPGQGQGGAGRPPGGGPGGPGGGPPPKPLTAEQVGLLRAWIDQGAK